MVVISAESESVFASLWAAAAVFATLGVGIGAMWATLRASNPKRRITYWMGDTPLLQSHHRLEGGLQVSRNGRTLADPRLVRIRMTNTSRRDVPSSAFDQSKPIRIGVGRPILESLGTESEPADAAPPQESVVGTELHIGPGRIGRNQSVTYLVLIDGEPTYSCHHSLIDVTVEETGSPLERGSDRSLQVLHTGISMAGTVAVGLAAWWLYNSLAS
ncbi:hypothetical protein F0L17_11480 [Streptomyces sp. TRM43335]|uniref:Uncharacterized protein n=1 Tax=Streptomyces taklimakanensis TaxID=2569853 RepID=A0A6G2BBY3_9ACTN|nr:hypothetical protein [Streptomyces taklimakanensis]MTE19734.1 hypothetical protein [Streptomyces taklimakanensis]